MLRPERMSKVSVTGSKRVMESVIEAVHELNLLHVTDYNDSWQGFRPGNPVEGAEAAADKLVTVRSLESILGVDEDEAGPARVLDDEALESELADVRERVNELDDRRDRIQGELRDVEERVEAVEPFADLDIDLDLLQGYDTLQVAVGEGDRDAVERTLLEADAIDEFEVYEGDGTIAVFARTTPSADEGALADALVSAEFATVEVPEVTGERVSPAAHLEELESRRRELESDLEEVEGELETVKRDTAGFLLAAEEQLTIEVQKTEAPLSFATTDNSFVAEGWIPTERYTEFASAIQDAVGSHAEVEELERAAFGADGEVQLREDVPTEAGEPQHAEEQEDEAEEEPQRAVADGSGGAVVMRNDQPPVVQDNPSIVRPFEVLVQAVGRPQYREFDPTVILFLTFPAFFGFMIGDLGYGALYTLIGYYLYSNFDSKAFKSMGGVTIASGLFTMLFGILYGEVFGLHLIAEYVWGGSAPIHKGLQPANIYWAQTWLVVSVMLALIHLNIGYVFGFIEELEFHGFWAALTEKGSWLLSMNGLWLFVFSRLFTSRKPDFIFQVFNEGSGAAFELGFTGFPAVVGWVGLAMFLGGAVLLGLGAPAELLEIFDVLVNVLSYTRIAAVLLAKAGMAFVVNLLFFGVFVTGTGDHAEWHFATSHMYHPGEMYHGHEVTSVMFPGLMHGGVASLVGGLLILVIGHLLVLALGVTSAGLQAVRLQYYEFFTKFFDGGGTAYEPFGHERSHTAEE
ncbi:V-type ATP synthase subunit I [Halorarum halophilum]|uniref:A-type ATP synthase subunit I n=1 Tax=Halorarum halophilum TaxID=2743090 RepID=A0A7D5GDX4_9EURY|nr:V-type ATP synthase subunit I [Halobaculum halophilum]QLG29332.1 V-type ATP synthase subunit I [Halobaculum halophilum]